jgi:hypothetical protein
MRICLEVDKFFVIHRIKDLFYSTEICRTKAAFWAVFSWIEGMDLIWLAVTTEAFGLRPAVSSSSSNAGASWITVLAMPSFWRVPFENSLAHCSKALGVVE